MPTLRRPRIPRVVGRKKRPGFQRILELPSQTWVPTLHRLNAEVAHPWILVGHRGAMTLFHSWSLELHPWQKLRRVAHLAVDNHWLFHHHLFPRPRERPGQAWPWRLPDSNTSALQRERLLGDFGTASCNACLALEFTATFGMETCSSTSHMITTTAHLRPPVIDVEKRTMLPRSVRWPCPHNEMSSAAGNANIQAIYSYAA